MEPILTTKGLTKRYKTLSALDNLDLTVNKGEILGYLGPNGAGKTTTIRLLLGLITPTSGSVTLFNKDAKKDAAEIHKDIAYVPGEANLWPNLTGAETLRLLANIHGSVDMKYHTMTDKKTEEFTVNGEELLAKVKSLINEGNIRRIIIKDVDGKTLVELPVTIGVVGALFAPVLAAVGAIAALVTKCTIVVERRN